MQKNRGIPFTVLLILDPCSNKQTGGGGSLQKVTHVEDLNLKYD